jgi:Ricin-type beta-trefoil lectin domain
VVVDTVLVDGALGSTNHDPMEELRMARFRTVSSAVALAAVAALGSTVAAAAPAAAATKAGVRPLAASYVEIHNRDGGLCLDAQSDPTHNPSQNGDRVQMWTCAGGLNQTWNINSDHTITNALGLCLDATHDAGHSPTNLGDPIQLWTCNGSQQQQWTLSLNPGPVYVLYNGYGLVLDAQVDATHDPNHNGDSVQLYSPFVPPASNQEWSWSPV